MNVQNIENLLKEGKELANIPMLYVWRYSDIKKSNKSI
jgi:hypothetical protein